MEKRAFLAVILMFLVLLLYEMLSRPGRQAPLEPPMPDSAAPVAEESLPVEAERVTTVGMEPDTGIPTEEETPAIPEKTIEVETNLLRATLSNRGPSILSWQLKKFPGLDSEWVELVPDGEEGGLLVGIGGWEEGEERRGVFKIDADRLILGEGTPSGSLTFEGRDVSGALVREVLRFNNSSYLVGLEVSVEDASAERGDEIGLGWVSSLPSTEPNRKDEKRYFASMASVNTEISKTELKHLKKEPNRLRRGEVHWAGLKSKYFVAVVVPEKETAGAVEMGGDKDAERLGFSVVFPAGEDGGWNINAQLYLGPIDYRILKELGFGLEKVVDFGHRLVRPLSKLIYWMLVTMYKWIPNYGLVIIILSTFTKVLFYPLTQKSMKSMQSMQELQPKMAALKEKYKNDPKRMNQEVMKLYKEHGVNPLGGCFPLLLQMPVFIALYAVLQRTIELRRAPFVLWIDDLSRPDVILSLPPPLPALSLLPILMGVSMFLQQRLSAAGGAGDPRQKMLGYMMPIFLTVIFFRMPSGLVLYWLVNTVLSIGQQYIMMRRKRAALLPAG